MISFRIDWFISLQSKRLSRVFPNPTVQKHQFFGTQLSLWSDSCIQTWLLEKPLKVNPNESSGTTMPTPSRRAWMLWGGEDTPWMLLPPLSSHLNRSSELWGCPGVNTSVCKRAEGKQSCKSTRRERRREQNREKESKGKTPALPTSTGCRGGPFIQGHSCWANRSKTQRETQSGHEGDPPCPLTVTEGLPATGNPNNRKKKNSQTEQPSAEKIRAVG